MKKKTAEEQTLEKALVEIAKVALYEASAKRAVKKIQKILQNLEKTRWQKDQKDLFLKPWKHY